MKNTIAILFLLMAVSSFGAVPAYTSFVGSNGITVISNPPAGRIIVNLAGGAAGVPAPPISSVQFNSNGVLQGSSGFVFTNGLVGMGVAIPTAELTISNTTATTPSFAVYASNNPTPSLFVSSNSFVGIGTATPANKLDVEGGLAVGATYSGTSTAPANGAIFEGNVGIGTASPARALHVNGSAPLIRLGDSTTATSPGFEILAGSTAKAFRIVNNGLVNGIEFTPSTAGGGTSFTTPVMVIETTGNVGIGTPTPGAKLEIAGTQNSYLFEVNTNVFVITNGLIGMGTATPRACLDITNGAGLATQMFHAGTNTTSGFWVGSNGQAGINVISTNRALDIQQGVVNTGIRLKGSTIASIEMNNDDSGAGSRNWGLYQSHAALGTLAFYSSTAALLDPSIGNVRFAMDNAGNVGVGLFNPASKLSVSGGLAIGAVYAPGNVAPTDGLLVEGRSGFGVLSPLAKIHATAENSVYGAQIDASNATNQGLLINCGKQNSDTALNVRNSAGTSNFLYVAGDGRVGLGTINPSAMFHVTNRIGTAGTPLMVVGTNGVGNGLTVNSNGFVGIGVSVPINILDVEGGVAIGPSYSGTSTAPTAGAIIEGSVGIGIVLPSVKFHVVGAAAADPAASGTVSSGTATFEDLNTLGSLTIGTLSSVSQASFIQSADPLAFDVATRLAINPRGGNVAIGTTAPREALEVKGSIIITNTGGGLKIGSGNAYLTNTLFASATLNFPSTAAGAVSDLNITVAGAADGDIVSVGVPVGSIGPLAAGSYSGFASNGVAYVRFANNALVTAMDPASGVFRVRVDKFQ